MAEHSRAQELPGRVRDFAHGGDAVVETEIGIVMARGALPGERVRVRVARKARGVLRGTIVAIEERSAARRDAPCAIASRCGGCPLMTLASEAQHAWKRERLARMLRQLEVSLEPDFIESPTPLGYRVRARMQWHASARGNPLGYHAAGLADLVDVETCLVLAPAQQEGLTQLRARLAALLIGRGEITLGPGTDGRCTIDLVSQQAQPARVHAALKAWAESDAIAGVALRVGAQGAPMRFGDPRQLAIAADGLPLWSPPGSFIQANPAINARLVAYVTTLAETADADVLELYAGHGNLSVSLARHARSLHAVEASPEAAEAGRQNLQSRGFSQARLVCEDAARGASGAGPVDVVVLDPPRAGAREALPQILARKPKQIVYVSCDLATLRRDLGDLRGAGFTIDAAAAFDMFPQTAHLESVIRLRR